MLLVGSVLLVRSFIGMSAIDPGFDPRGLLAVRIRLTLASSLPLSGRQSMVGMNPRIVRPDDREQFLALTENEAGPDFFSTMRIPILQRRAFVAADREEGSEPVCIVSEALAHELWPYQNPIGQGGMGPVGDNTVVGVAADVRTESLERESGPAIHLPAAVSASPRPSRSSPGSRWSARSSVSGA